MKAQNKRVSIKRLCRLFGYTSQNFYKTRKQSKKLRIKVGEILDFVKNERMFQPKIGTEKLYYLLQKEKSDIKIGRDGLYNILRQNHLLVRRVKRYRPKMTDGNGQSIYPDLRKGLELNRVNQLWCSDITYIDLKSKSKVCYLTLITDEASHLIVGYEVSLRMQTSDVLRAFEMASKSQVNVQLGTFENDLVIHSDRGSQYKSQAFIKYTDENKILRSMCAAGMSHENPVAERINGILKNELLVKPRFKNLEEAKEKIKTAIEIYNDRRPHLSCDLLTPAQAHELNQWPLRKRWKQRKKRTNLDMTTNSS